MQKKKQKPFVIVTFITFQSKFNHYIAKMKTDGVILSPDAEAVKFENSSFSLMPHFISSIKRQTQSSVKCQSVITRSKFLL